MKRINFYTDPIYFFSLTLKHLETWKIPKELGTICWNDRSRWSRGQGLKVVPTNIRRIESYSSDGSALHVDTRKTYIPVKLHPKGEFTTVIYWESRSSRPRPPHNVLSSAEDNLNCLKSVVELPCAVNCTNILHGSFNLPEPAIRDVPHVSGRQHSVRIETSLSHALRITNLGNVKSIMLIILPTRGEKIKYNPTRWGVLDDWTSLLLLLRLNNVHFKSIYTVIG